MLLYEIIETDEGLTIVELEPGGLAEEVAERHGGVVVDTGPFNTYDEAYDVILALQDEEDEEGWQ
jgi:hypothetical protein